MPFVVELVLVTLPRGTSMTASTARLLRSSSAPDTAGSVGTGSLTPASWAIRSVGIRGHRPASSRVNTS
jgi:hypothetical protein